MTNIILYDYYTKLFEDMINLAKKCEENGEKIEAKTYYLKAKEFADLKETYRPIEKMIDETYQEKKESLYDKLYNNEYEL